MAPVLALSLSGSLTKLSVIVSIAALVGVALMSLLFFAQARELKRLREWAGRAPERAEELARSFVGSPRPAAPAPRPVGVRAAPAAVPQGVRVAAGTSAALAPAVAVRPTAAGTAVAGLAVAGELPASENGAASRATHDTQAARSRPGAMAAAATAPAAPAESAPAAPPRPAPVPAVATAPAISAAGAALAAPRDAPAPASATRPSLPPPPSRVGSAGQAATGGPTARASAARGAGMESRAGVGRAATIYRRERTPARKILLLLGSLLVVAIVAVVLVSLLSSKGGSTPPSSAAHPAAGNAAASAASRGSLQIAVLNATETDGLAAGVAHSLKGNGYAKATALYGTPAGSYPVTVVEYGGGRRAAAAEVAKVLHVSGRDVKPMPSSTAPLAAGANLVVIVGQAAAAQSSSETSSEGEVAEGEVAEGETDLGETAAEPGA